MSSAYTPALTIGDVTVGTIASTLNLGVQESNDSVYIAFNISKLSLSGIYYTVAFDASGQMIVSGSLNPGGISLTDLQQSLRFGTWVGPSGASNLILTSSFVYGTGAEQGANINLNEATRILPRASFGMHTCYAAAHAIAVGPPGSLAGMGNVFADASGTAAILTANVAASIKSTLESAAVQDSMLKAILAYNGANVIGKRSGGTYSLQLNGQTTDLVVGLNVSGITLVRSSYDRTNNFAFRSPIPVMMRVTHLVPDLMYDVDSISTFVNGQTLTTWQNSGTAGSSFDASGGGATMRLDASGRRYLENVINSKYPVVPIAYNMSLATDAYRQGFTLAIVYRLTGVVTSASLLQSSTGATIWSVTASGSQLFTANLSNQTINAIVGTMYVAYVVTSKSGTGVFGSVNGVTWTSATMTLPGGVYGPIRICNLTGEVKAFHLYRYGMEPSDVSDLVYRLRRQYAI